MKKILKLLALLPMLLPLPLSAQLSGINGALFKLPGYMDNVVPPSPTVAHVNKYADTPVSYSLGLPDITIPIYTIKTRELELPISLSYHASGIKVAEIPGPVGLGWSLNAGGAVTKTVVGLADGSTIYSRDQLDPARQPRSDPRNLGEHQIISYLDGVISNREDSFYDRYNYSYNGNSGSFIIALDENSGQNVIKKTTLNDDMIVSCANIRDPYGNKYYFGVTENVKFNSGISFDMLALPYGYESISSYYLSSIESYSGTDNISLNYTDVGEWTENIISHTRSYSNMEFNYHQFVNKNWTIGRDTKHASKRTYKDLKLISEIEFDGGSVKFDYEPIASNKLIIHNEMASNLQNTNIPYVLSKISIIENGCTVKVFNLTYDTFSDNRTMLKEINAENPNINEGNTVYDSYTFNYYNPEKQVQYYARDLFGYYNGKDYNKTLCYKRLFPFDDNESDKRRYSSEDAKAYSLSEIITRRDSTIKTRTCYEYEENRHDYEEPSQASLSGYFDRGSNGNNGNNETVGNLDDNNDPEKDTDPIDDNPYDDDDHNIGGGDGGDGGGSGGGKTLQPGPDLEPIKHVIIGLRINNIKTYDGMGSKPVKERRFEYAGSGCTIDFTKVANHCYLTRSQTHEPSATHSYSYGMKIIQLLTFSENSILPGASPENARIFYNDVTEHIIDGQDPNNSVKVRYIYDCDDSQAKLIERDEFMYDPDYSRVGVMSNMLEPNINNPEWWFRVRIADPINGYLDDKVYKAATAEIDRYFMEKKPTFGNLKKKITYKTQSDGQFVPVEKEINKYKKFNTKRIRTGLCVRNIMSKGEAPTLNNGGNRNDDFNDNADAGLIVPKVGESEIKHPTQDCYFFDVFEEVSCWKLVSSQRIKYFDSESTNGSSEPKPQKSDTTDYYYNGASIITPSGDQIGGSLVLPEEIDNTVTEVIVGPGVESVIGANINLITFQPKEVVHHIDGDVYRHRYKYTSDFATSGSVYADMKANNNIYTVVEESITKNNTDKTSILNEFKHVGIPLYNQYQPNKYTIKLSSRTKKVNGQETGKYTVHNYDMYGNPACVSVNGMAPTCYIWGYGNKYPVAEIKNATYQQIKDALGELAIHNIIESPTLSDILLQRLNNLRNTLPDALITIYTYEPMWGISSITDPSGRTTTFHYDEAGRLNATKDVNGNIIETYEYKNM